MGETLFPETEPKVVQVAGKPLKIHPGQLVRLTEDQSATRRHNLRAVKCEAGDVFEVTDTIEFKIGEEVVFLSPIQKDQVRAVTPPAPAKAEPRERPEDPEVVFSEVEQAIDKLDPENKDDFTGSGLPRVEAIEALLGYDISADERNHVWELMNEDPGSSDEE